tara:strand:+ start:659 stop:949 length:291 start_codon:yes stop_codon:yes gene_type:complete
VVEDSTLHSFDNSLFVGVLVKVGDLVRYKGWGKSMLQGPIGVIVDQVSSDSKYHHKIRVMWVDKTPPIQAQALSVSGDRITTWVSPKHFEVMSETE